MLRIYLKEMNWQHFLRARCRPWRFADFFAKGSGTNPVGNPRWGTGGYVFAPRHGPLVWHYSLKHKLKQKL
jgi:hypothetical protein